MSVPIVFLSTLLELSTATPPTLGVALDMTVRLTQRLSFRWLPEPATESTDTLVMSVSNWFIDLRISLSDGSLDWGFAGEEQVLETGPHHSMSYQLYFQLEAPPSRSTGVNIATLTCAFLCTAKYRWTHIIDSQGYTEPDIGSLPNSASGDFLESGTVPHPETKVPTEFEERWRTVSIPFSEKYPYAWILQSEDGKTFLGQTGGIFQSMTAGSGGQSSFCARRELWDGQRESWVIRYEAGDENSLSHLPHMTPDDNGETFKWHTSSREGDIVNAFGGRYVIRALSKVT